MTLAARVERTLAELGVEPDEPIAVACSGGADSVALVHLVAERPDVTVLHVDHHLRSDSSDDADFVRESASALGLRCVVLDVRPATASEADAREARYAALGEAASTHGLRAVLTGHSADDQAETVLLRLMRGDTLDGIAPRRGIFVRPLLDIPRAALREWLVRTGVPWREDPTNADVRFERNWVRHVLLPQLRERRPGVDGVLARTSLRARDDALALDAIAHRIVSDAASDDVGIFVGGIDGLPRALAARVIRSACRRLGCDPTTLDVDTTLMMRSHVRCRSVDVWRLDDGLAFTHAPFVVPDPVVVPPSGVIESERWGVALKSTPGFRLRSRRDGDRVATALGTRKVQDVLVDAKVPRLLRPLVPILADGDRAVAVVGGRVASAALTGAEPFRQTWSRQRAWIT